jgi:hypothetical protein
MSLAKSFRVADNGRSWQRQWRQILQVAVEMLPGAGDFVGGG